MNTEIIKYFWIFHPDDWSAADGIGGKRKANFKIERNVARERFQNKRTCGKSEKYIVGFVLFLNLQSFFYCKYHFAAKSQINRTKFTHSFLIYEFISHNLVGRIKVSRNSFCRHLVNMALPTQSNNIIIKYIIITFLF